MTCLSTSASSRCLILRLASQSGASPGRAWAAPTRPPKRAMPAEPPTSRSTTSAYARGLTWLKASIFTVSTHAFEEIDEDRGQLFPLLVPRFDVEVDLHVLGYQDVKLALRQEPA